jgi:hypothetical protein
LSEKNETKALKNVVRFAMKNNFVNFAIETKSTTDRRATVLPTSAPLPASGQKLSFT